MVQLIPVANHPYLHSHRPLYYDTFGVNLWTLYFKQVNVVC